MGKTNAEKIKANKASKINQPTFKCQHKKCKKREWIKIECNKCLKSFCLRHRAPDSHKCDGDKAKTIRQKREKLMQSCAKQMMQSNKKKIYTAYHCPMNIFTQACIFCILSMRF